MIDYWPQFISVMIANGLLAASTAFAWGRCGVMILGPALFFGIGAYAEALALRNHTNWELGALLAIALAASVAALTGAFTLGRPGGLIRFGAATFVLSLLVQQLAIRMYGLTGGSNGILVYPSSNPSSHAGTVIASPLGLMIVAAIVASVCLLCIVRIEQSLAGAALTYLRDCPESMIRNGVNVGRVRLAVVVVCVSGTALAGALYAPSSGIVSPEIFDVSNSMRCLAVTVLAGMKPVRTFIVSCFLGIIEMELGSRFADIYLLVLALLLIAAIMIRFRRSRLKVV